MLKKLISIAGLTGTTCSYLFLAKPSNNSIGVRNLKVRSETNNPSNNCYVLEKLDDWKLLVCYVNQEETKPHFYLQELNTTNKSVWKINKLSLNSERDKFYFLRFNLEGNQTHSLLVSNPIKYFWINNLDLLKDCRINFSSQHLYCERISELNRAFAIISLDKYL